RVTLAPRGDVAVAGDPAQRMAFAQCADQEGEPTILRLGEAMRLVALELDADREVVAALAFEEARSAGMPGARVGVHELQQLAASSHEEMRRDAQRAHLVERRMGGRIEAVREQPLDRIAAEPSGRQADVM